MRKAQVAPGIGQYGLLKRRRGAGVLRGREKRRFGYKNYGGNFFVNKPHLRQANELGRKNRIGYRFTITLFTALGKKLIGYIEWLGAILFM